MGSQNKTNIDFSAISDILSRVIIDSLSNMRFFGCFLLGRQGEILHINQAARDLLGIAPEHSPTEWSELFDSQDRKAELPRSHMILCANEGECAVRSSLGLKNTIEAKLYYRFVAPQGDGLLPGGGYLVFVEDNRYIKDLEREIDQIKQSRGVSGENSIGSLRELCHKMRSPLTLISLSVNLLRDYSERMTPGERAEELKQIEEGLNSCEAILAKVGYLPKISKNDNTIG